MRKRIFTFLWALLFVMSMTAYTAKAADAEAVRSVTVRIGNKNVTKTTHTLAAGKSTGLKVTASPARAVKSVRYASQNTRIASVDKNGKVTAKSSGTAKINITVTGQNKKKLTSWVKIKVTGNQAAASGSSATTTIESPMDIKVTGN